MPKWLMFYSDEMLGIICDYGIHPELVKNKNYHGKIYECIKKRKESIHSSLSFYLIDDLVGVVMGYSLTV